MLLYQIPLVLFMRLQQKTSLNLAINHLYVVFQRMNGHWPIAKGLCGKHKRNKNFCSNSRKQYHHFCFESWGFLGRFFQYFDLHGKLDRKELQLRSELCARRPIVAQTLHNLIIVTDIQRLLGERRGNGKLT